MEKFYMWYDGNRKDLLVVNDTVKDLPPTREGDIVAICYNSTDPNIPVPSPASYNTDHLTEISEAQIMTELMLRN